MKIYNTLSRQKETFHPLESNEIKMYVCGPTVYNYVHIGNARVSVFFDVVRRFFEYQGQKVTYIQNLTDVDDKIINAAAQSGVSELDISTRYANAYMEDLASLGVKPSHVHPKVSDHMPQIIAFVQGLIDKGMAYEVNGDVYYRVEKFDEYGKLSNQRLDSLQHTQREVVEIIDYKENEFDFALWKRQKANEIAWDSPWGKGRPGWHIECSAMSRHYLGDSFDIHGGGMDLCFPHHDNEIAQSEGLTGKPMAHTWMHNNYVTVDGVKMSKSLGNFTTVRDALEHHDGETVRLFFLSVNYRNELDYSQEALHQAKQNKEKVKTMLKNLLHYQHHAHAVSQTLPATFIEEEVRKPFISYLEDDFDTASAVTHVLGVTKRVNQYMENQTLSANDSQALLAVFQELGEVLGVTFAVQQATIARNIQLMVSRRDELKKQAVTAPSKEEKVALFQKADAIRSELHKQGIILEDTPQGTRWKVEQ